MPNDPKKSIDSSPNNSDKTSNKGSSVKSGSRDSKLKSSKNENVNKPERVLFTLALRPTILANKKQL